MRIVRPYLLAICLAVTTSVLMYAMNVGRIGNPSHHDGRIGNPSYGDGRIANPSYGDGRIANPSYNLLRDPMAIHSFAFTSSPLPAAHEFCMAIPQKGGKPKRSYLGFRTCIRCHNSGVDGEVELPGGGKLSLSKEQWVLYKEYPIWAKEDKHGQAYTVLLNDRSRAIGKLLGVTEIHRDRRCLACHTGFPLDEMPIDKDGLVDRKLEKNLDINLGVSCEGCHGPAGDQRGDDGVILKGWMDPHQIAPKSPYDKTKPWRFLAPQVKRANFGFYDVRSPSSKTKLCVSCHIGDVAQGRIVTHEMFAAGHPPLPGFELETFTQQMPRHWSEFSAKSAQVRDLFLKNTHDANFSATSYQQDGLQRTRSLLVGAVMAASEYLRYVGQLADEETKSEVRRPDWPEFAAFDCYACHHELKSPSWRQERKQKGRTPGRPALQEWPFTLARIALQKNRADLDAKLNEVHKAIDSQPFGNPSATSRSTLQASRWLRDQALELEKKPISRSEGIALLQRLAATAGAETLDYDSARQIVWAYQLIDRELRSDYANAAKVQAVLEPFADKTFLLNLRGGRKAATAVGGEATKRTIVEIDLDVVLPRIAAYEPADFRKRFGTIQALLK